MALIEAKDLQKIYFTDGGETAALQSASFTIHDGEFVAIMGPSGSGKSTLLHVLGFLDKQTGGEYRFDGKTIDDFTSEEIAHVRNKKMGFVFQAFNLLPRMTVLENVKLPLLYSDIPEEKWDALALVAIKTVRLEYRAQFKTSQLSGGEKQRVAIARALVNNPQVIFADEPTGNLDSKSGQIIMETLQNLNEKEGHTIILITHESHTAQHAGRIIRILDGEVAHDELVKNRLKSHEEFEK